MENKKLTILIIIFIVLLFMVFSGVYFFIIKDDSSNSGGGNPLSRFFPSGNNGQDQAGGESGFGVGENDTQKTPSEIDGEDAPVPILRKISFVPTSGAVAFTEEFQSGDSIKKIRYTERGTGHVFETLESSLSQKRISNTTIPKVQEALWGPDGESLIIRYLNESGEDIESFSGELIENEAGDEQEEKMIDGSFLQRNISEIVISKDGKQIFYLVEEGGETVGIVSDLGGGNKKQVFSSPISEWQISWPTKNILTLNTKPSHETFGTLFFSNPNTGSFTKIFGNVLGLTTNTSPDGSYVLYSEHDGGTFRLNVYEVESGASTRISVATLPEKCVWSKQKEAVVYCGVPSSITGGSYPDIWYQGIVSFSDALWEIDVDSKITDVLIDPSAVVQEDMDMINLFLDENESRVYFMNKKDRGLWSYELNGF